MIQNNNYFKQVLYIIKFHICSLFGFIVLHMLMYGGNTYLWRHFRVNYLFIFGFKQGTELGYREVFLLASGLSVLTLAAVLSNLDMEMDPRTKSFKTLTELVPLGLVTVSCSPFSLTTWCNITLYIWGILLSFSHNFFPAGSAIYNILSIQYHISF